MSLTPPRRPGDPPLALRPGPSACRISALGGVRGGDRAFVVHGGGSGDLDDITSGV
jgi:hypothetical protein